MTIQVFVRSVLVSARPHPGLYIISKQNNDVKLPILFRIYFILVNSIHVFDLVFYIILYWLVVQYLQEATNPAIFLEQKQNGFSDQQNRKDAKVLCRICSFSNSI